MMNRTCRSLLVIFGLAFSTAVYSQQGGFGGNDEFGQGIFGSDTGSQRETSLEGAWVIEFELEYDSDNPREIGERITVRADVTVLGTEVNGRFRRPAQGNFSCTAYEGSDHCDSGRLFIVWPDQDDRESASFEFVVDGIDGRRAQGEASFASETGGVRLYSVNMRKR